MVSRLGCPKAARTVRNSIGVPCLPPRSHTAIETGVGPISGFASLAPPARRSRRWRCRRPSRRCGREPLAQKAVFSMLAPASGDSRVRRWQRPPAHPRGADPIDGRPPAMTAATLAVPAAPAGGAHHRLRQLALVRIAGDARTTRSAVAQDLAAIVPHRLAAQPWRQLIEGEIEGLLAEGALREGNGHLQLTPEGAEAARRFLGGRGALPRAWSELRDERLVAKALGLERLAGKDLKALARPDGLRAGVVQGAYKLKLKGLATPSRLRAALATLALERAFGNQLGATLSAKRALPAKAGRLLAAQLARNRRDFGTDRRLIAALAAEHVGVKPGDSDALRRAVLCRFFADALGEAGAVAGAAPRGPARLETLPRAAPAPLAGSVSRRPDLPLFVLEVRRQAGRLAEGWSGNRKAYISHVWRVLAQARADWGLSEIEFKCMLLEAHRAGQLALAHADLKDHKSIKDVQESAVVYKNAVFHFVRADG